MRKGEELKAPRYASAAASCDDYVTIYNIIPNNIGINKDDNYGSFTPVPLSKEGFILAGSLLKDYPSVDYEGVSLL